MDIKTEKRRVFHQDTKRILSQPFRLRKDLVKQGLKPPLNKGEAQQILAELLNECQEKSEKLNSDIQKYLQTRIKEDKENCENC